MEAEPGQRRSQSRRPGEVELEAEPEAGPDAERSQSPESPEPAAPLDKGDRRRRRPAGMRPSAGVAELGGGGRGLAGLGRLAVPAICRRPADDADPEPVSPRWVAPSSAAFTPSPAPRSRRPAPTAAPGTTAPPSAATRRPQMGLVDDAAATATAVTWCRLGVVEDGDAGAC